MLPNEQDKADKTLQGACLKLTRQAFYNQSHTSRNQFSSEHLGKPSPKHENVKSHSEMTEEDYAEVSKLSIRFYVVAKVQLHYLFFT